MKDEKIKMFNEHAKFLAEIGIEILKGNKNVLDVNGVKEIISLYLLIPYITDSTLETPDNLCKIPQLKGSFINGITLENLRNTIAHSFVTVEELMNDGSEHGKYLIFDDRIIEDKKVHSQKGKHSNCYSIYIDKINKRLTELFNEVVKS